MKQASVVQKKPLPQVKEVLIRLIGYIACKLQITTDFIQLVLFRGFIHPAGR
jgi:hypothetical protein